MMMVIIKGFRFQKENEYMCVTTDEARIARTIVYLGEKRHPVTRRHIHVMGYQNNMMNMGSGPNAMLLHFPCAEPMDPGNIVDATSAPSVLNDMAAAYRFEHDDVMIGSLGFDDECDRSAAEAVHVARVGIYDIVMSATPTRIPEALQERIPADKRPSIDAKFFEFYERKQPGCSLAVCCFNNRDMVESAPLLFWYEPQNEEMLMIPGIDAHDGDVPNLDDDVHVDHWLFYGSEWMNPGRDGVMRVNYTDVEMSEELLNLLPDTIVGRELVGRQRNGDFLLRRRDLLHGEGYLPIERGLLTV